MVVGTYEAAWALFVSCILFLPFICRSEVGSSHFVTVDVHSAKRLLHSGHRYLDVRTEEEYKKGHVDVENCFNIPYMFFTRQGRVKNPSFVEQVCATFSKDDHLIVGCQSGVRSVNAVTDLLEAGFKHVSNMGGGYIAWEQNEFSIKTSDAEL